MLDLDGEYRVANYQLRRTPHLEIAVTVSSSCDRLPGQQQVRRLQLHSRSRIHPQHLGRPSEPVSFLLRSFLELVFM